MLQFLMVDPKYFDVAYAINPHMLDENGVLNKIDQQKARSQWESLKQQLEDNGHKVHVLEAGPQLPDMVFCANQSLPFTNKSGDLCALISAMQSAERQPEVSFFEDWYEQQGYTVSKIQDLMPDTDFEGMGDLLISPNSKIWLGGFGKRTDAKVYSVIENLAGKSIETLELVTDDFYHLDTCFVFVTDSLVAYVPEAFSKESQEKLEQLFPESIRVNYQEAKQSFCLNGVALPDDKYIGPLGSTQFYETLRSSGFEVIEVDTSEFIKSGGSAFCMTMQLPS